MDTRRHATPASGPRHAERASRPRHAGAAPRRPAFLLAALLCATLLAGCATAPPFPAPPELRAPAPYRALEQFDRWIDAEVFWGGMIIEVRNFARHTEVEILAFPLDRKQRPMPSAPDQGRFVAILAGFADPATLPQGRFVTRTGRITGDRRGSLRGREYTWPEVDVAQLHLWRRDFRTADQRWSIGVGVAF